MSTQIAACVFIALAGLNIVLDLGKDHHAPSQIEQSEGAR
jgi:hypothetical protein